MREILSFPTNKREQLLDITNKVKSVLKKSKVLDGIVTLLCSRGNLCNYDTGKLG